MRRLLRWLRRWFGRGGRDLAGGLPSQAGQRRVNPLSGICLLSRDLARLTAFAAELDRLPVDLIFVAGGAEPVQAAKHATDTIPIVFAICGDPVAAGL